MTQPQCPRCRISPLASPPSSRMNLELYLCFAQLTTDRPSMVRREPPVTALLHLTLSIHSRAICLGSPDGTIIRARPLRTYPGTSRMSTSQCNLCDQSNQKVRNRIWHLALVRRNPMDVRTPTKAQRNLSIHRKTIDMTATDFNPSSDRYPAHQPSYSLPS
jgi:hypothetical protein